MSARIPEQLVVGTLRFRIYRLGDGRLAFDYKRGTQRIAVKRRGLDALRAEAERIATGILNAETAALDVTAEDRRIHVAAREALAPLGLQLDAVARDVATAATIAPGVSITELARFYAKRAPKITGAPETLEIVRDLLAALAEHQRSAKYLAGLRRDLERFAPAFADLSDATTEDLSAWLRELRDRRGQPIGPRRRNNVRDAIVRLFHFAREKGYLPEDRKTAADRLKRLNHTTDVTTYTPAEISHLLEHAARRWRPWLAIGAFAGLRTSEIFRLDWSAVKWEQKCIAVSNRVARKIRISRKVPMSENLIAWLSPWRDVLGPIYPCTSWSALESAHRRELRRLKKATGIAWDNNALRHSFGSYRLALVKNEAQVALEMGNSVAKVRENYHDPKSEAEARQYFDVQPATACNIIPLPLEFSA